MPFFAVFTALVAVILVRDLVLGAAWFSLGNAVKLLVVGIAVTGLVLNGRRLHAVLAVLALVAILAGLAIFGLRLGS